MIVRACPFCGSYSLKLQSRDAFENGKHSFVFVQCLKCGACGPRIAEAPTVPAVVVSMTACGVWNDRDVVFPSELNEVVLL